MLWEVLCCCGSCCGGGGCACGDRSPQHHRAHRGPIGFADAYSDFLVSSSLGNVRKKLLIKIFAGPVWEPKLLAFVGVFAERRDKFKFALAIHTAVKLDSVYDRTEELSRKYVISLYVLSVVLKPELGWT